MIDSLGFREAVFDLPEQMSAAVRSLSVTGVLPGHDEIANVLVLGTGAAGWVGDLLAAVAGPFMPVPLVVHKGYEPPSFVDPSTLVIAISASGDSPEVLASAGICVEVGAKLFAITSGGQLGALADATESPTVFLPHSEAANPVPPRARVGALAVPALKALDSLGLYPGGRDWISSAIAQLRARRDELGRPRQRGRGARPSLAGSLPLVYGGGVARRRGGRPVEGAAQPERQDPGVRRRAARCGPRRARGLGPARRHHPADPVARPAPPRR